MAPTTYHAFFGSSSSEPGSCTWEDFQASYVQTWTGYGSGPPEYSLQRGCTGTNPDIPHAVLQEARAKALDKVRNTDFNALTSMGEIRSTGQTLVDLLGLAVKLLSHPAQLVKNGASSKKIAEAWLTVQYGIKPLISDCAALADFLNQKVPSALMRVKAVTLDGEYGLPASTSWYRFSGECTRGVEVSYTFAVKDPTRFDLWRLGLINPFALAWELTTLSFVVDWFTGLGNFLQALIGPVGLSFVSGYQTVFVRNNFLTERRVYPDHAENVTGGWQRQSSRTRAMSREALYTFERPLPYFSLGLSPTRVASALALLRTFA